jgi:hypothetical protein
MASFDRETRVRLSTGRNRLLIGLSGGSIVYLAAFLDILQAYRFNHSLLVLALIGLAFTLFVATGLEILTSAADRWMTDTVNPALLVWEWRMQVAAFFSFMLSGILIVSYLIENIRVEQF